MRGTDDFEFLFGSEEAVVSVIDTWQDTSKNLACLKANGITAVGRYYSKNKWKRLGKAEAAALSADGFTLFAVYQDANNKYDKFSKIKGQSAAQSAIEYASSEIGQPEGSAIYFSVDYDASPKEADGGIRSYFEGVRSVFDAAPKKYKIGVYGNGAVCDRMLTLGLVDYTWLSMSKGHHGHKDFYKSNRWALCQKLETTLCGMDVDPNETNPNLDFGGFRLGAAGAVPPVAGAGMTSTALVGKAYVKTEGLNLRDAPDGNIVRALTICDPLEILGSEAGWFKVRTDTDEGYVFPRYVRPPATEPIERLLRTTIDEWIRFDKGAAQEEDDPYAGYVGQMWAMLKMNYDGRSKYENGEDVPWSAAFISYVVGQSGKAYKDFAFAASHSVFVHDAIQARILDRTDRPFWGYRIEQVKPGLGDIIARNRAGNAFSFDYAETHSEYKSHSDIVVEVTNRIVRVMGGNVGDTVSISSINTSGDNLQEYDLDADGFIKPGQKVIAILKNRAHEV